MYILHYMPLIDLVFPKVCVGCGQTGSYLCINCIKKAPLAKRVCIECGKLSIDGFTHSKCKKIRSLDGVVSIWKYDGVIKKSLLKLKFRYVNSISQEIAKYSSFYLKRTVTSLPKSAFLLPIPLYRTRKNFRGFNQTEEVGKLIAKSMGWGYQEGLLIRIKKAKIQSELNKKERIKNIKEVFSVNTKYLIHNTTYILFDDVCTTGSTLKEACRILNINGVKNVWGLTIAK